MILLALAMVRRRLRYAAALLLLAAIGMAAAVAGPVYADAARVRVAERDLAAASPQETVVTAVSPTVATVARDDFAREAAAALVLPGFETVLVASTMAALAPAVAGLSPAGQPPGFSVEFRDGFCGHVALVAGRCATVPGEAVVTEAAATNLALRTGGSVAVQPRFFVAPPSPRVEERWIDDGGPTVLSVVGVYRPASQADLFWTGADSGGPAVLVDRSTMVRLAHSYERQQMLAYPRELTAATLQALRPALDGALRRARAAGITCLTTLPDLLVRIESDQSMAVVAPGWAGIPLILLSCFVIFLTVASGASARRAELALLGLRGLRPGDRWWLAAAGTLVPLGMGSMCGYLLGQVLVTAFLRWTVAPSTPLQVGTTAVGLAGAATAAAVVAALLALRYELAEPVVALLRRVAAPGTGRGGVVILAVSGALALAATIELALGPASGVAMLAPPLVVATIALAGAAGFGPVVGWLGRRWLRGGHLGFGLAAAHLARRRGGPRVVALLAVAVGQVAFAAAAWGIGVAARPEQVAVNLGAYRVVQVKQTSMRTLLHASRTVDREGTFAMAVVPSVQRAGDRVAVLAVDSPRLAQVAHFPAGGPPQEAALLRPATDATVAVQSDRLAISASLDSIAEGDSLTMTLRVAPWDGSGIRSRQVGPLLPGRHTYLVDTGCASGCRLMEVGFSHESTEPAQVTLARIATDPDGRTVVDPAGLHTWVDRQAARLDLSTVDQGLVVRVSATISQPAVVGPPDVPARLAALVSAGTGGLVLPIGEGQVWPVQFVGRSALLPRVGAAGALVDLEYLIRGNDPGAIRPGEVWLGPAAPADAPERLRAAGLEVTGVRDYPAELAAAALAPNAIGMRFHLAAGVLALALAALGFMLAAVVEIDERGRELAALRVQGLPRRIARRAALVSHLLVVWAAAVLGAVAAAVAWLATSDQMPLIDVMVAGLATPAWPGRAPLLAWTGAVAVLVMVGGGLSAALGRAVRRRLRRPENGRSWL